MSTSSSTSSLSLSPTLGSNSSPTTATTISFSSSLSSFTQFISLPDFTAVSRPSLWVAVGLSLLVSSTYIYRIARRRLLMRDAPSGLYSRSSREGTRAASVIFEECIKHYTVKQREKILIKKLEAAGVAKEEAIVQANVARARGELDTADELDIDDDDAKHNILFCRPNKADIPAISQQNLDSFNEFNASIGIPPEFAAGLEQATAMIVACMEGDESLIAADAATGEIIGSAFNDETDIVPSFGLGVGSSSTSLTSAAAAASASTASFNPIHGTVGCGPWSVKWGSLHRGIGRKMLTQLLRTTLRHGARSIRLIQITGNLTALSLYTSFGFESREQIHCFWGEMNADVIKEEINKGKNAGWIARPLEPADLLAADLLHTTLTGVTRANSLHNVVAEEMNCAAKNKQPYQCTMAVFDSKGKMLAYNTGLNVLGHSCATSLAALKFLLAHAYRAHSNVALNPTPRPPPKLHSLSRLYPELERWLLQSGVKIQRAVNLMVLGEWQPVTHDQGIYCCSIVY